MRTWLDTWLVTIHDPTSLAPSAVGLEVVVIGCAIATLVHALRAHRRGDRLALATWLTILIYGVAMEVISYNTVDNFKHAQFTVMFYKHQLPLYVTAVYPAFLYTGIATVRRLSLSRWAEPFAAGLVIVAMDFPFDILGPVAGWWTWSNSDPNLAFRWHGVPVSSYYWHLAFGGVLCWLTRALGPRTASRRALWRAAPLALLTIVLGVVAFLPFHGLHGLGVAHGTTVAGALVLSLIIAVQAAAAARRKAPGAPDLLLLAVPVLFFGYHLALAFAVSSGGRLAVICGVTGFAALVNGVAHRPASDARPAERLLSPE